MCRPIYIGKNQNKKEPGFLLLYRLHCQKNPNFWGFFLQEKRMHAQKKPESHSVFW